MIDDHCIYRGDTIDWLLEEENPSVRYFTLKYLMDQNEKCPEVQQARQSIMQQGIVPQILEKQNTPEYRANFGRFYRDKYTGIVWQLIVLAEHGAQINDQIREQCEYLFQNSQERQDGGFSFEESTRGGGGLRSGVVPCLTGNLVYSLVHFGYLEDERLQKDIDWITAYQRFDDGDGAPPAQWPYERYEMCWGRHTCHMGAVKALKGLAAIPEEKRSPAVKETIARAVEYLLIHHIHKKSHELSSVSKPGWLKLGFPLMYQADVLEILDLLTSLHIKDARMAEAIEAVVSKQCADGRWKLENSYNDKLIIPVEKKGAHSKWITLKALRVLKRYGYAKHAGENTL
jgi:hypothetical protein